MAAHRRLQALALGTVGAVVLGGAAVVLGQAGVASAAAGCRVDYTVNQWTGGFTADVKLTAGDTGWSSWSATWTYPAGQRVTSGWNATVTQAGTAVTATSMSYNGAVPAGGSASFGVQGTWISANPAPVDFAVNGVACNGAAPSGSASPSASASHSASASPSASVTPSQGPPAGCSGAVFCDGFEGASAWTTSFPDCSGSGAAAVDATVAHSGSRSMRIDGAAGYCNHVFVAAGGNLSAVSTVRYARFYVRHTTALPAGHVAFAAMRDANDGNHDLRMGGQNGALQWNRSSDDATLPEQSPAGVALSRPLPTGAWNCVEFMVNGTDGTMQTWLNGADVTGLHEDGVATQDVDRQWLARAGWRPSLTDFRLGWESYGDGADTLWFDDVALSTARIGC
jgi:hypothetical protein